MQIRIRTLEPCNSIGSAPLSRGNHKREQFHVRLRWAFFFPPLFSERADLFDWILPPAVKIYCQGITGVRQIRGAAPSWQRNNAVLFDFCFEQHLAVATRFVTTVTTSGIRPSPPPLFLEAFERPASTNRQYRCQTCQRHLVLPVGHRCTLRSSSSSHKSDVWFLPCSIPAL